MQTIRYLQAGGNLGNLNSEFGIEHTISDCGKKVILNYSQIDSPKNHPIVQECCGLCLEIDTWRVVAKSFNRFFNYGELPEYHKNFNFKSFSTQEKVDGSLLKLYYYNNEWRLQTRGSFAQGEIVNGANYTWYSLFFPFFKNLDKLHKTITLVCEGVSPYNQVVRLYKKPDVYLLTAFNNETLEELRVEECDEIAEIVGLKRPQLYTFSSAQECVDYLENLSDFSFEGFVLRDDNNLRIKIKNKNYLLLHRTINNHVLKDEDFLNLVLDNEYDEFLSVFPKHKEKIYLIKDKVENIKSSSLNYYKNIEDINNQKDFAIKAQQTKFSHILFNLRKNGGRWDLIEKDNRKLILLSLR